MIFGYPGQTTTRLFNVRDATRSPLGIRVGFRSTKIIIRVQTVRPNEFIRSVTQLPINSRFRNVPTVLRRIHRETIDAFNGECFTLCATGLRGLVEGICADQSVTDGPVKVQAAGGETQIVRKSNLEGKISGLCEKGILTKASTETLHEHRFLGNDAVHELAQPSHTELMLAIEIIEHTLEQLYEIPEKAVTLKEERARRQSRIK